MTAAEVLASLESAGVTVTFDRPTGRLHVRPRPVPASAAEVIRSHREILVGFLSDPGSVANPEELLERELGATVVGKYENNGDEIPDEFGGTWGDIPVRDRQPAAALEHNVKLGAEAVEHYQAGSKVKTKRVEHGWAVCDQCGEGTMRPKSAGSKKCMFTPGCEGSHQP
jgi:hypothetical protein